MTVRVAINGFGRIGRCVARAIFEGESDGIELVAINGRGPIETHYHLFKYDSIHGTFKGEVKLGSEHIEVNGKKIKIFKESEPQNIPWKNENIDVVFECTGVFKTQEECQKHIEAGAKKVIISAPAKDDTKMIVYGVNHEQIDASDNIISIGSCTTNCLAPVAKVLNDKIGIEKGFVTTVHAVTNDQNITDARHSDLRRARAAQLSIIPTSTGAAKVIGKIIPELNGKLDGTALRVPTQNVSLIDFCFEAKKQVTAEEVNETIKNSIKGEIGKVLAISDEPLVSIDYNHNPKSSIFDTTGTKVLGNNFVRIMSWYDNEWGFSVRMLDVAKLLVK